MLKKTTTFLLLLLGKTGISQNSIMQATNNDGTAYDLQITEIFAGQAGEDLTADLGLEGLIYIPFTNSPSETGLMIIAKEVRGTLCIYFLDNEVFLGTEDFDMAGNENFSMYPNPASGTVFLS